MHCLWLFLLIRKRFVALKSNLISFNDMSMLELEKTNFCRMIVCASYVIFITVDIFFDIVLYTHDCKLNQTLNKLKDLFRVYLGRPKFMCSLIYMLVLVWMENGEAGLRRINIYVYYFNQTLSKIMKPTEKFRITQDLKYNG